MVDAAARKARGAYFTPPSVAKFMIDWAIRSPEDRLLEPSCGEAVFLLSAVDRLRNLGAATPAPEQLTGVDIHSESVAEAQDLLLEAGTAVNLHVSDFFTVQSTASYDAVVGNPPYIRYQTFTGEDRARAKAAALAQGVRVDGLSSSWAPFVIHAASFLQDNGRLALVLPAELLSVNYAAQVRSYLLDRFAHVRLVLFNRKIFPGVLENVLLLLAEGRGPTDHFEVVQADDAESLQNLEVRSWSPKGPQVKWTTALIPHRAADIYSALTEDGSFLELEQWGATDLGMVTGNNKYFTLNRKKVQELGIPNSELMPISPPGSRHLRGLDFTEASWHELAQDDRPVYLFNPEQRPVSSQSQAYIDAGEKRGVNKAYKCRVRKPWWLVPKVQAPDLFLTYMNHDTPRLVANRAQAAHLNSIHGVFLKDAYKQLGSDLLPIASLNSITLLGAELVGRSYGGGMLKIEPREGDRLPVPSPQALEDCASELQLLRPQLARHLRNNQLLAAVHMVDRTLLLRHLKISSADLEQIRTSRDALFRRRTTQT